MRLAAMTTISGIYQVSQCYSMYSHVSILYRIQGQQGQ